MNLKDYIEEYELTYQHMTNITGIGGNRLNRLRAGSEPVADELRRLMLVTDGYCDDFRDDPTLGYKRRRLMKT